MACDETPVLRAIMHAAVAGGCRIFGRTDERAASGLNRAADFHSRKAATFLNDWMSSEAADAARSQV